MSQSHSLESVLTVRDEQLALLGRISQPLIHHKESEAELQQTVFEDVARTRGLELFFNYLVSRQQPDTLWLASSLGLTPEEQVAFAQIRFGEYLCGTVAAQRAPLIIEDIQNCDDPKATGLRRMGGCFYAGFPLIADGQLIGTVAFSTRADRKLTPTDLQMIQLVCDQVAVTLERARAQIALRESEEKARLFIAHAPAAVAMFDREMRYIAASHRWRQDYGLSEELMGRSHYEVLPEITEAWKQGYRRALAGAVVQAEEDRFVRADSSEQWLKWEVRPWFDTTGAIGGIIIFSEDITARKHAAEQLQAARDSFQHLVENSPFGVYAVDADFRLVLVSAGAQKVFANVRPLLGRDFDAVLRILWPEPFASEAIERFRHTLATGAPYHSLSTIERRHDSGEVESYDWKIERITLPDGRLGVVCHFYDLSEHQRYEAELRASEERFRTLADNISQFAWMADEIGSIFWYNQRWFDYTGTTLEEMRGWGWQQVHHPEHVQRVVTKIRHSFATGEPWEDTFPLRGANGTYRWFLSRALPIRDTAGCVVRWFGTNTDITERLEAEREREQILAREQQARESAEAATRAKDNFLALVTHELRNPLQSILGYTRMTRLNPHDADEVLRNCEIIERSARVQQQLIEDLLDTARIVTGKLKLATAPTDLRLVLADTADIVRPAAAAKQIDLDVQLGHASQEVLGDAARLQQVAWNLLQNAIKFTPVGGHVRLLMERLNQHVRFTVCDDGKGIEPEFLPYVFDRFTQSENGDTQRYGGLGLGLALARQLVEMHGGTIEVKSRGIDQGTAFTVTLPALQPQQSAFCPHVRAVNETSEAEYANLSPSLAGIQVLVVDDESDARDLIATVLGMYGAQVRTAGSGEEALQLLTQSAHDPARPQVLVCDIGLPGEDGYALLHRIRTFEATHDLPPLPAIALTGFGRAEDRLQALMAGFQIYLAKPVEPLELVLTVSSLIERRSQIKP
ncbi:MAG TPA: PAS domain-containing protein [Blastocatellia bacterium]|nr:PAS domain-containing protein [Blastocatellia bacterium]